MSQPTSNHKGISISLQELIDLRKDALCQPDLAIKKHLTAAGQRLTLIRGAGIEFDTTREYQPGDDMRTMAWRVTARSLKPHIKVYREEKERPVWLGLDLGPSMYFGTRCMFKSVRSILEAALLGWGAVLKRDRLGAIISLHEKSLMFPAHSGEKNYLHLLNALAQASTLRPNVDNHLLIVLKMLQQQARAGSLIHLYSDFLIFDEAIQQLLIHLAERTQMVLHFIYDPFEATPPPPHAYFVTDGQQKKAFNMQDAKNRAAYKMHFEKRLQTLQHFSNRYNITLQPHCTDKTQKEAV